MVVRGELTCDARVVLYRVAAPSTTRTRRLGSFDLGGGVDLAVEACGVLQVGVFVHHRDHHVDKDASIKSQLASRNQLQGLM